MRMSLHSDGDETTSLSGTATLNGRRSRKQAQRWIFSTKVINLRYSDYINDIVYQENIL